MEYMPRIADGLLKRKLAAKGAVLVEGAKWCGKTTTSARQARSILYMQDPDQVKQNLELARIQPSLLLKGETPRLIDEWQMAENLWDAVRFEVDRRNERGQFILTGSAVPPDLSEIHHTGTGRIARLTMRPMSLYESGESNGSVSLSELFDGRLDIQGESDAGLEDIAFSICRGGWPGAMNLERSIALEQAFDYLDAVVSSDISRVDHVSRDEQRTRKLLASYARDVGSQASIRSIRDDMRSDDADTLTEDTVSSYLDALRKIFVIEDAPAWNPNLRSRTAVRTSGTRYFTDPSIAAAALGAGPEDLLNDLNTMGLFFENLCVRDLRVYADALDGAISHYRDRNGLECDAVLHRRNGSYGLFEIKLGGEKAIEDGAASLKKLSDRLDTTKMKKPAFRMVLTAVGKYAYRREDGILAVPVSCLRP